MPPRASAAARDTHGGPLDRLLLVLEVHQRDELHRPEVRPSGHRHQQHRLLQPHLTRSLRRRSGDSVRSGRRHVVATQRAEDTRRHRPVGLQRARTRTRSSSTTCSRRCNNGAAVRRRPAPLRDRPVGRPLARPRRRHRHRARRTRSPARSSTPASPTPTFIARATTGFDEYARHVEEWTLERGEQVTGVPADAIRELAHAYATAERAQLCWTLGITEHHNGVDNVLALINLALLRGHVGRYGAGPQPAARPEQRAGRRRHGRHPQQAARLPGHRRRRSPASKFETAWGDHHPGRVRLAPHRDVRGDGARRPARRSTSSARTRPRARPTRSTPSHLLEALDHLVVQDIFLTKTAELADVVLPGSASWCESEGTVTNCERRVQRVPQGARSARRRPRRHRDPARPRRPTRPRLALRRPPRQDLGRAALAVADARRHDLRAARGARRHPVAVLLRGPARAVVPARAAVGDDPAERGRLAPFSVGASTTRRSRRSTTSSRCGSPPAAGSTRTTPACSRAASAARCASARRSTSRPRTPRLGIARRRDGARLRSRRRAARSQAPVRIDPALRPGLVFMTYALPRRGRHQRAHDRRHRPEVGHRRVQGLRRPDRPPPRRHALAAAGD